MKEITHKQNSYLLLDINKTCFFFLSLCIFLLFLLTFLFFKCIIIALKTY